MGFTHMWSSSQQQIILSDNLAYPHKRSESELLLAVSLRNRQNMDAASLSRLVLVAPRGLRRLPRDDTIRENNVSICGNC